MSADIRQTMTNHISRRITVSAMSVAVLLAVLLGQPHAAAATACPALPDVAWWSKSHDKVIAYVQKKYKGDWEAYLWKWQDYRLKALHLLKMKKPMVLKSRGIELKGRKLSEYARKIHQRVAVIKCLSRSVSKSEVKTAMAKEAVFKCRPVPKVPWWGDLNHEGLIALVGSRYKGNWQSFIKFWETETKVLLTSFNLGHEAIVNKTGLALNSEELALYYAKTVDLVAVLHCLAEDAKRGKR